jgi:peptide chain release factor 1
MAALAASELETLEPRQTELEASIRRLLVPKDPRDEKNVLVEIRAGAGGDEAALFAADLARMYMRYAEGRRWKTEIVSAHETGQGGYKELIFEVKGVGLTAA